MWTIGYRWVVVVEVMSLDDKMMNDQGTKNL